MQIALVIGNLVSADAYAAYEGRTLLMVQPLTLERKPKGPPTMAVDYVGAGEGDIVLLGAAPGLASAVLKVPDAPVRELVMGIVDRADFGRGRPAFGNEVPRTPKQADS